MCRVEQTVLSIKCVIKLFNSFIKLCALAFDNFLRDCEGWNLPKMQLWKLVLYVLMCSYHERIALSTVKS